MTEFSLPEGGSIVLSIDGIAVAGVKNYRVTATREGLIQPSVATESGAEVLCGEPTYRVELTRLEIFGEVGDEISIEKVDKSSVSLQKPGRRVTFFGCRWVEIEESCAWDTNVLERVVFLSTRREEVDEG